MLVESYRTDRGPRQRVISYLGQLKEEERLGVKQAVGGNNNSAFKQRYLFDADNKPDPQWVEVDTANIRVENQLDFGGPWLAMQLIHKLKLDELFDNVTPELLGIPAVKVYDKRLSRAFDKLLPHKEALESRCVRELFLANYKRLFHNDLHRRKTWCFRFLF